MRTRSVAAALLVALAPMTMTVPGFAQTADDPSIAAARARFNEGVEFFDKGQFEQARASFLQAYALHKHPTVLLNLAQSSLRAGHNLEAAKYFQQYLHDSSNLTPAQRSDGEKGLADARAKLGRIDVSAPTGNDIFIDGDHVGTAPLAAPIEVDPGTHTVKANSDSKTITVVSGQSAPVRFAVGGGGAPIVAPVPTPGPAIPSGPTGSEIPPPDVPPTAPSSEGQPAPPPPAPVADTGPGLFSPPASMAPVYLGAGVAILGLGGTILFAVFKSSANTSYESLEKQIIAANMASGAFGPPPTGFCVNNHTATYGQACQNLQTDYNQVNTDATFANISVAVGVAGLAFGLGWYLFAAKRDAKSVASSFSPILEPHQKGFSYGLTF